MAPKRLFLLLLGLAKVNFAHSTAPDGRGGGDPVSLEGREENAKRIPCPFLAGLYKHGILKPDGHGRVSSNHMKDAMVSAGSTIPNAVFPSFGTVRFKDDDMHQTERYWDYGLMPAGLADDLGIKKDFSTLWLNIMTMNVGDTCVDAAGHAQVSSKFPCNANPQHVQHGYSTTIRDPRHDAEDPAREKRFKDWIESVLVVDKKLHATERVMNFDGDPACVCLPCFPIHVFTCSASHPCRRPFGRLAVPLSPPLGRLSWVH